MKYDTEKDLRKAVEKRIGYKLLDDAWIKYAPCWMPPYDNFDLQEVVKPIPRKVKRKKPRNQKRAYFHANSIPKIVRERVEEIRMELFGKTMAPFTDLDSMDVWIRQQAESEPAPEGHAPRYGYKLKPGTSFEELQELMKTKPGYYGIEYAALDYPNENGLIGSIRISDGTKLRKLWLAVRWIADRLDCQDAQATAYILVGLKPLINPLKVEIQPTFYKDGPSIGKITIIIREPVSTDEMIDAYRKARSKLWGYTKDHQLPNDKDYALIEFMQARGVSNNPDWESLRLEWNQQNKDWSFEYWRNLKVAYSRAKDKIFPPIKFGPVIIKS
jgi:hypothetical protein